jgi:hypothetical protein
MSEESRRKAWPGRLAAAILLAITLGPAFPAERGCPAIGAIRWDAWHGADGPVGRRVERTLGPEQWHDRLPFCSRVLGPDKVEIECDTQEAMDREIGYAADAGLSYWVFATTAPDDAMSRSFRFYLSSARKSRVNFSLRSRPRQMGRPGDYSGQIARFVQHMKDPSYQKVAGNRPLFYIGFLTQEVDEHWGGAAAFRAAIDGLRAEAVKAGLANPYIAVMEFNPERAKQYADTYGFDAITTYATRAGNLGAPYAYLARGVEQYWDRSRATGAAVIPIAMTGWDNRPKLTVPMRRRADPGIARTPFHYEQGQPAEIARHIGNAMQWVAAHPAATPANAIIVYAWNEHDEGGWLKPTLSEGAARVKAVGETLRKACPPR